MKRLITLLLVGFLFLAACAEEEGDPETTGQSAHDVADLAGAVDENWDEIVAAAQEEGEVVFLGPSGTEVVDKVTSAFREAYGIEVIFSQLSGSEATAKLKAEREAGESSVDIWVGGATSLLFSIEDGILQPVRPFLREEVLEPGAWFGGETHWVDEEQEHVLVLHVFTVPPLVVNPEMVDEADIEAMRSSWDHVLDPKFEGMIGARDPCTPSFSWSMTHMLYLEKGEDFIDQFFNGQNVQFAEEERQVAEWVVRGKFAIGYGVKQEFIVPFEEEGLPIETVVPEDFPGMITGGAANLGLLDKAPHPNAAVVFANWLAGPEGNEVLADALFSVPGRTDVSNPDAPDYVVPDPDVDYVPEFDFKYLTETAPPAIEGVSELVCEE